MSRWPVARRALSDLRWQVFWFGVGLAGFAAFAVWLYPPFEEVLREIQIPPQLLQFFGGVDMASPSGYLTTRYQTTAPIVLVIYAVVASTGLLAGEEGRGSLELLAAQPLPRSRLMLEKMAGFLAGAVMICILICIGWLASVPFVDLHGDVTLVEVIAATFAMLPIVVLFGALGFLLGALAPSRGVAAGLLTGFAVASYFVASFARAVDAIAWTRYASPFYYADAERVLREGMSGRHAAGLLVAALLVGTLAVLAFRGREIGVSTWQPLAWLPRRRTNAR